jgi:DNA-binding transcriptional regulator YiaG
MGKVESIIKSEIIRLAKREMRKITVPMRHDVRSLKSTVSQLRKTVSTLEKFAVRQDIARAGEKTRLQAPPEEVASSRFSPRLIRALRKRLGLSQKKLAALAGVTVGAIYQWEKGIFEPRDDKKGVIVALRKMGRRDVKDLLQQKAPAVATKRVSAIRRRRRRRAVRRVVRRAVRRAARRR